MTYLAPRQGLFAIILLISFCLQAVLLVFSTEQQMLNSQEHKANKILEQLVNDTAFSIQNQDLVSLSMIGSRYTNQQDIARIIFKNNQKTLVSSGNAQLQSGLVVNKNVTYGNAIIGEIQITFKTISNGEIIAMQWPFVLGSFILHLFLWLIYGYIARPTKQQIQAIGQELKLYYQINPQTHDSENIQNDTQYATESQLASQHTATQNTQNQSENRDQNTQSSQKESIKAPSGSEINNYLKQRQSGDNQDNISKSNHSINPFQDNSTITQFSSIKSQVRSANRPLTDCKIQIVFFDQYNLLSQLSKQSADIYFALCSELLNSALQTLFKQDIFAGIHIKDIAFFERQGAIVHLSANENQSRLALSSVMVAKLYLMLNDVIYKKHIELHKFALPIRICISDLEDAEAVRHVLTTNHRVQSGDILILLPNEGVKQVREHVELRNFKYPNTVYERESAFFEGCDKTMMDILVHSRNLVLIPN